jgi:hypothetical protein
VFTVFTVNGVKKYLCVHKEDKLLDNCTSCCGITNLCGKYQNKYGLGFYDVLKAVHPHNYTKRDYRDNYYFVK